MQLFQTADQMGGWSGQQKKSGLKISFVPTMGALHEGHLALIRLAKKIADKVVVSIFVNPTQFDDPNDLKKYPRGEDQDLKLCEQEGVDVVFTPIVEEMYPDGLAVTEQAGPLAERLCGASRPGHFDGVVTVVSKLFDIVQPDDAVFGQKDYQQLAIIRSMVERQKRSVDIISHSIVRESDGLAMSSRNRRLTSEQRIEALALSQSLQLLEAHFLAGERSSEKLLNQANGVFSQYKNLKLDYAEIIDAKTLESVSEIDRPVLYAVAASIGDVRLIDNAILALS